LKVAGCHQNTQYNLDTESFVAILDFSIYLCIFHNRIAIYCIFFISKFSGERIKSSRHPAHLIILFLHLGQKYNSDFGAFRSPTQVKWYHAHFKILSLLVDFDALRSPTQVKWYHARHPSHATLSSISACRHSQLGKFGRRSATSARFLFLEQFFLF
jgi:hypothetical protein